MTDGNYKPREALAPPPPRLPSPAMRYRRPVVSISRLKKALGNLIWKHGVVSGPGVVHHVQADGSHVFTITVSAMLAEDDEPKATRTTSWGASSKASPEKT
jgi:hypothetical protein